MRALQIIAPGRAKVVDASVPRPEPDEVLVRVEAVATCPHWDMHILGGVPMFEDRPLTYPYVLGEPGHEAVGYVEAVGADVSGLPVGARVAAWRDPGGRVQGCYAQYVALAASDVLPVSTDLPAEAIASLELAMCVQVSVDQLVEIDAVRGQKVAVAGLGPAGLIAVQLLRHAGAREVVAIEPDPARHELGNQLGAHRVVTPEDTPGGGRFAANSFHAAIDTTGLPVSIEALMTQTRRAVAIFGVLREKVSFGPDQWWGGFSLIGYGEHNRAAAERSLRAIEAGHLDLRPLISRSAGFAEYEESVDSLRRRSSIKVLFDPWK